MNEKIKSENHQLKPLIEGKFIFKGIMEGDERKILFNPPLIIEYKILEKIDKESDKENFSEDWPLLASFVYDFGMPGVAPLDEKNNMLVGSGYEGLTKDSSLEDILEKSLWFDLFHALCHPPQDPNYTYYHHALFGWLRDRAIISEVKK